MSKRLVASAIGKHTDEKEKDTCYFDTYAPKNIFYFSVSAFLFFFKESTFLERAPGGSHPSGGPHPAGRASAPKLADANGVYRMKRSRSRGGIRLISGDMSEEFEPKSEPVLDGVEGGERPGLGAFLVRRRGSVWSHSGGREESAAGDGGMYLLSGMKGRRRCQPRRVVWRGLGQSGGRHATAGRACRRADAHAERGHRRRSYCLLSHGSC